MMDLGSDLDLDLLEYWNVTQEVLLIGIDRYRRVDCVGSDKPWPHVCCAGAVSKALA
jgi:hypothetical protein